MTFAELLTAREQEFAQAQEQVAHWTRVAIAKQAQVEELRAQLADEPPAKEKKK